ncbi:MAG: FAD-dependent oxidoreductase [Nitrospirae bacterium]|nr:FAD-dependent oxidoreductase [Nitrospirota bacterium]
MYYASTLSSLPDTSSGDVVDMVLRIVGGGPARLTAGIYAGRSGLKAAVLEKSTVGGQALVTPVDGVFIAIGYTPKNEIAKMLGLAIDEEGYIKVDGKQRTSLPMVYAAGDVTGGIKQIATAVGQGAVAAITVFEDLSNPYWKKKYKSGE